ncbi:MAG: phosphatidylglycerol:prolipoprotein diacylglycerol transferase [Gammaproteobacteria bacterium]|jgi:phosphatidylglycerol:prolipoprotein diacylglycerol transferase
MIAFPDIDPVAIAIGPLKVHWYGLMYLAGFAVAWWLGRRRTRDAWRGIRAVDMDDVLFFAVLGIIAGGRIGYLLFYGYQRVLEDPTYIFRVWEGGMSFHGGLVGVILAVWWFARSRDIPFFQVADFVAPLVPPGLFAGRIGNFINGNLWGAPSDLPWAMVFPAQAAGDVARHPSQLYEALLEGVLLFAVLWCFSRAPRPLRSVCGLFLLGYGLMRFSVEFVRVPDSHLGYLAFDWLTMGQALSAPMIILGIALMLWGYQRREMPVTHAAEPVASTPPAAQNARRSPRRSKRRQR